MDAAPHPLAALAVEDPGGPALQQLLARQLTALPAYRQKDNNDHKANGERQRYGGDDRVKVVGHRILINQQDARSWVLNRGDKAFAMQIAAACRTVAAAACMIEQDMLPLLYHHAHDINRHHQLIQLDRKRRRRLQNQPRVDYRRNRLHALGNFLLNGAVKAERAPQKRDKDCQPG